MHIIKSLYDDMLAYGDSIKNRKLTPASLTTILRKFVGNSDIKLKTSKDANVDKNQVIIGGSYDPEEDQANFASITIYVTYNPLQKRLYVRDIDWAQLCIDLIEVTEHELVHQTQYRNRNYDIGPNMFVSMGSISKRKLEQEYLGSDDEVEAYANSIAVELYLKFGLKSLTQRVINKSAMYKAYVAAFNKDHHVVVALVNFIHYFYSQYSVSFHVKVNHQVV